MPRKKTIINVPTECLELSELCELPNTTFEDICEKIAWFGRGSTANGTFVCTHGQITVEQDYMVTGDRLVAQRGNTLDAIPILTGSSYRNSFQRDFCTQLLYATTDGVWHTKFHMNIKTSSCLGYVSPGTEFWVMDCHCEEWKLETKMIPITGNMMIMNCEQELLDIITKRHSKYASDYFENLYTHLGAKDPLPVLLLGVVAPELEQLGKAGYTFCDVLAGKASIYRLDKADVDAYNRLCKTGSSIKKIFKTSKAVYEVLKNESDVGIWNTFRKMEKTGKITGDQVGFCYENGFSSRELSYISEILNAKYNGKPVFSFSSLIRYLERLDVYEAIEPWRAFDYLKDYLRSCRILGIQPKTNSDSLIREHDVVARMCMEMRNREIEDDERFESACREMAKNNYEEKIFMIRAITDYEDLYDESKQQRNVLFRYGKVIEDGRKLVYVMRDKSTPDKSLITVELNSDQNGIQRMYMAHNRPVRNKAQNEFLRRWIKLVKLRNAINADCIEDAIKFNNQLIVQKNMCGSY